MDDKPSHCPEGFWVKLQDANERLYDAKQAMAVLREALAAAEAECAAARAALNPPGVQMVGPGESIIVQPSPAKRWSDLRHAADANDATRARLGMLPIK